MKKSISLVLLFGMSICLLSGCSFFNSKSGNKEEGDDYVLYSYADVDKEAKKVTEKVSSAIIDLDVKELKGLFSEYMIENSDLDKQLQQLLSEIDGNIISVENLESGFQGGSTDYDKGSVYNYYYGRLENIKTDTGKEYSILIKGIFNYEDSKDKEGINKICLRKVNEDGTEEEVMHIGELAEYKED